MPPSPPKDGGGKVDSATGAVGDVVPGEAGRNSAAASVSECPCEVLSSGFLVEFLLTSLYSSDKQSEDRPRSPSAAAQVSLEAPQHEVEKTVGESTVVARGILDCHSALAMSDFLYSSTSVELSSTLS